jgi:D-glycero-alpha-D-manno-heptose-7-phosphate kinase
MGSLSKLTSPRLVITRTPMRVSFSGGGTDLATFYEHGYGAVFSTAINKYIYVTVKQHGEVFDKRIRLNYSKSEQVQSIDEIENNIARECLRLLEVDTPIYISTVGDLPACTGLGSSSCFAVGLLNALHAFRGDRVSAGQLAEEACHIEIDVLKEPIGKQDQYAAAFGGLNYFRFRPGGGVTVEPQRLSNHALKKIFCSLMLFWTGIFRDSGDVLSEQKAKTLQKMDSLVAMREQALELQRVVGSGHCDIEAFGAILDRGWQLKQGLANSISSNQINGWYQRAREAGAYGGKICGAGGGGFLLFVVPSTHQNAVKEALPELTEVPIGPEVHGSQILLLE